jgi:hypothetical protein
MQQLVILLVINCSSTCFQDPSEIITQHHHMPYISSKTHEYGSMNTTLDLLKPLSTPSLLIPHELYFAQYFHKEGKLISEQIPSQPKVLTGAKTCAKRTRHPRLLAIPAFDRKAGLNNRHLNSNRGICLR